MESDDDSKLVDKKLEKQVCQSFIISFNLIWFEFFTVLFMQIYYKLALNRSFQNLGELVSLSRTFCSLDSTAFIVWDSLVMEWARKKICCKLSLTYIRLVLPHQTTAYVRLLGNLQALFWSLKTDNHEPSCLEDKKWSHSSQIGAHNATTRFVRH